MWKWASIMLDERTENADWAILIQLRESQRKAITFETFRGLAEPIEVFPVDLWHEPWAGDVRGYCGKRRLEVTFEKYLPLHDFVEVACCISRQELFDVVSQIDRATPKEKALILTAIYIHERLHRRKPKTIDYRITNPLIYPYKIDSSMTSTEWTQLISHITRFKNSFDIAFPAFVGEVETIKNEWKRSVKKYSHDELIKSCFEENTDSDIIFFYRELLHGRQVNEKIRLLHDELPAEAKHLLIFREFLYTITGNVVLSGMGPWEGNSSVYPKTLGDIATQLLMSRLAYDEDEK